MNDVLPKPFTRDSLLGMLEKHLLHMKQMKQMQQMGHPNPNPKPPNRLIELTPEEQQQQAQQQQEVQQQSQQSQPSTNSPLPPTANLDDQLDLDDPNLQFSYDPNYAALFGPTGGVSAPHAQGQPTPSSAGSARKRRAGSDLDPYEYLEQRTMPRSTAGETQGQGGKRARYNTPPW